jgi:cytochrome P450
MRRPPAAWLRRGYAVLRTALPLATFGKEERAWCLVSRHDDVRQVLLDDRSFEAPYAEKLPIVVGDAPFLLGLPEGTAYRNQLKALQAAVTADDVATRLPSEASRIASRLLDATDGEVEVVGLTSTVTAETLGRYFGIVDNVNAIELAQLARDAQILFKFQFADPGNDPALRREVDKVAPLLRARVKTRIADARAGRVPPDTLIARYINQVDPSLQLDDTTLVAAMTGFIVGGLPQPPMVVPNALDQLLRRPAALAAAQSAAREGKNAELEALVFEAMRFDPLGPLLNRIVVAEEAVIAPGTRRARTLKKGARVLVFFASAMLDPRRVDHPARFDPHRHSSAYMHFGYGLHECFASHINRRLLPAILKPLLVHANLRRVPGRRGALRKNNVFPTSLCLRL